MQKTFRIAGFAVPSLSFILLALLFAVLWIAGGASRGDVWGQVFVRGAAWSLLVVAIVFGPWPALPQARSVVWLLVGSMALLTIQLAPLPPGLWRGLPGRELTAQVPSVTATDVWRPWALVPGGAANSLFSLIVPATTLWLVACLREDERAKLPAVLLSLVLAGTVVGLLQLTSAGTNNPLINESVGLVSGTFANRNHFALFAATGCMLASVWAFQERRKHNWRPVAALALTLLFLLTILATGSRAGLLLGVVALVVAIVLSRASIKSELTHLPRWAFPALLAGIIGVVAIFVLISVAADRAVSLDRVFLVDPGQDMRSRGLSTVFAMIAEYLPLGSGFGGFDPLFRIHEPFALLKPTYFNHAHNDFLEVVLDAGLPGALLLITGLSWWAWASLRAWRAGPGRQHMLPKLGSAILLLVILASLIDYPARTPMILAIVVIAAVWLGDHSQNTRSSALPRSAKHL